MWWGRGVHVEGPRMKEKFRLKAKDKSKGANIVEEFNSFSIWRFYGLILMFRSLSLQVSGIVMRRWHYFVYLLILVHVVTCISVPYEKELKYSRLVIFWWSFHGQEHYKDLKDKSFFPKLIDYITSGPVVCMVYFLAFTSTYI